MSNVLIGHAVNDENGKASKGAAGDQTGKEVCTRNWYKRSKGWSAVFRAKEPEAAEKIAKAMEQACANDNIGYDQSQRTTLYPLAKGCKWDLSKVSVKCETDCSALVAVCVNAAGITVSKDMYTGNEEDVLNGTGRFTVLKDASYLEQEDYLKRGDILLGNGHTAVVLSDGACVMGSTCTVQVRILKKGYKGEDVRALQILLAGRGYDPNGIDASFGSGCQKAVKAFQSDNKLDADGIVGHDTWNALL